MKKIETPLKDLYILEPRVFGDDRGFFFESFNADGFRDLGIEFTPRQANYSRSAKGVLRGLHHQNPPKPMAKLVRCTRGKLFDVAVDLRKESPTYLQWFGVELSEENKRMLFIPEGFGHGFYALEDCDLSYLTSNTYDQELDANFAWNDPAFGVEWPVQGEPMLSGRDADAPSYSEELNQF